MKWRLTQPPYNLSLTQPILRRVFLRRNLVSTIQNVIVELSANAVRRQFPGEAFRQTIPKIDTLYAALMQQTGARAPLCGTGDLSAIQHYVRAHWVSETNLRRFRRLISSQLCSLTTCNQSIAKRRMNHRIN